MIKFKEYKDNVTIENYPMGFTQKVKAVFEVETKGRKKRLSRKTWNTKLNRFNKPKKSTYGMNATFGIAEDGKVYGIIFTSYGISFTKADLMMQAQEGISPKLGADKDVDFEKLYKKIFKENF